jgi:hypothetical protein
LCKQVSVCGRWIVSLVCVCGCSWVTSSPISENVGGESLEGNERKNTPCKTFLLLFWLVVACGLKSITFFCVCCGCCCCCCFPFCYLAAFLPLLGCVPFNALSVRVSLSNSNTRQLLASV